MGSVGNAIKKAENALNEMIRKLFLFNCVMLALMSFQLPSANWKPGSMTLRTNWR